MVILISINSLVIKKLKNQSQFILEIYSFSVILIKILKEYINFNILTLIYIFVTYNIFKFISCNLFGTPQNISFKFPIYYNKIHIDIKKIIV